MKAEITFSQVWANPSVRNFFFREQSEDTLQELSRRAEDWEDALERIEKYANNYDYELDEIEEMFYDYTVEDLADEFEIDLYEEEEEDDGSED